MMLSDCFDGCQGKGFSGLCPFKIGPDFLIECPEGNRQGE